MTKPLTQVYQSANLGVSPRVSDDLKFVVRLLTYLALSLCLERCKHDDDRIIFRRIFDQVFELVPFESNKGSPEVEIRELFDFVGYVILFGPMTAVASGRGRSEKSQDAEQ